VLFRSPLDISLSNLLKIENVLENCIYGVKRTAISNGRDLQDIYDGSYFQENYKQECLDFHEKCTKNHVCIEYAISSESESDECSIRSG
jgi:hypothetical protein